MASTFVNDLRLTELGTGDASGTWGNTTNVSLELIGEALGFGTEGITTNADTHASTVADGATDQARAMYIRYTGTLDSACTITIGPNTISRMHFIENATSGAQNIIISQGSGANVTIPPGDTKAVYLDGAGGGAAVVDAFASLNVVDLKVQDDLTVTGDIDLEGSIDVNGTTNLNVVDVDGAVNFAADVTFATGADIITASAGDDNVRIGVNAGNSIASGGDDNVVIGRDAGTAITTGDKNVAIGFEALATEDAHSGNTAIGYRALKVQDGGAEVENTAIGKGAGQAIDLGRENVLVGANVGDALTHADFNVAIGNGALGADIQGHKSTAIGYAALNAQSFSSSTDANNTAVGYLAGAAVTTGQANTLIGMVAGDALTDADHNVAIGVGALSSDTLGSRSTAIGKNSLVTQNFTSATDTNNTAVGFEAGKGISTGVQNTLMGALAGDALTDADFNVAIGSSALSADTKGNKAVAIGHSALSTQNLTSSTDIYNVAIGHTAGTAITTGGNNTIIGGLAGVTMTSAGISNVILGFQAGSVVTTPSNTLIGTRAGALITSGEKNTVLGRFDGNQGGTDIRTASNNIVLSDGDGNPRLVINIDGRATFNNTVDIPGIIVQGSIGSGGIARQTTASGNHSYIADKFRNNSGGVVGTIEVSNSATAYNTSSDYRLKENVSYSFDATSRLKQLKPARFNFILDADTTVDGFIAHEVSSIVPEAITGAKDATESMANVVLNADGTRLTDDVTQEKWIQGKAAETYASDTTWVASQTVPKYQSIDQSKIVPLLVKTILELEARITALEGE